MSDFFYLIKELAIWMVGLIGATIYLLGLVRQCFKIFFEEQLKMKSIDEKRRYDLKKMYLDNQFKQGKETNQIQKGLKNE